MKKFTSIILLLLMCATAVFADLAPPKKTKSKTSIDSILRISLEKDAKEARLVIPRGHLQKLRAALDELGDGGEIAATTGRVGLSGTQTIVSGLFLSLAIVFGGLWFARSGRSAARSPVTLASVVVFLGLATAATIVYANAGPPPEARSITGRMFSQSVHLYKFGSGRIKLEVTNEDREDIELIVPDPQATPTPEE